MNFIQVENNIYRKVAPPAPDASPRPLPPLRIRSSQNCPLPFPAQDTHKKYSRIIARGLIIFESLLRDGLQFDSLNGTFETNMRRDKPMIRVLFN